MALYNEVEKTAVIICGGGPTGALLSAMLGEMQVPNVVIEQQKEIVTDPRGIALDEDGIRCVQDLGMYHRIFTEMAHCQGISFIAGSANNLFKTPFMVQDLSTTNGHTGHVAFVFHKQPELERAIRDVITQNPCSQLRLGCTLTTIEEVGNEVEVTYMDADGVTQKLRASYLVGCDGKTGFVRKKYLEPRGVTLDRSEGINYDETWVALNWHIRLPTPQTHPDFPLWALGYTPQQVYDAFFPQGFRFLCDPLRPSVCGRFGLESDRLWRFEFVVRAGEDPDEMASIEATSKVILPYLIHPGSWYGAPGVIQFPVDCVETLRSRPFSFLGRVCNKWSVGRVLVAGDAAHVFPPFGGQGIVSGFRDASSLAWRLAHLYRNPQADYEKLLQGWYAERKQQLSQSLAATVRNGEFLTNTGFLLSFARDWILWSLQQIPYVRGRIQEAHRPSPKYKYEAGFVFRPDLGGGIILPQVYCRRIDGGSKAVRFTDDLIFDKCKDGLLQLLILLDTVDEVTSARAAAESLQFYSQGLVDDEQETILIQNATALLTEDFNEPSNCIARVATAEEFMTDPVLSCNRPPPKLYDEMRIKNDLRRGAKYVLVRRDRYVYAACVDQSELHDALRSLPEALALSGAARPRL